MPAHGEPVRPHDELASARPERAPASRRRRWLITGAGLVAVAAAVAGTVVAVVIDERPAGPSCDRQDVVCSREFALAVRTDPDLVPADPADPGSPPLGSRYLTDRAIDDIPAPPDGRDDCRGRSAWAVSIGAVPVDRAPVLIEVTARSDSRVRLVGFSVHRDAPTAPPVRGRLLSCASSGRAEPIAGRFVELDLGRSTSSLIPPVPAGGPGAAEVEVAPGQTASLLVAGTTDGCYCRWRIEAVLEVRGERHVVTIGPDGPRAGPAESNPDQPSFATTAPELAVPYRYLDGAWRLADDGGPPGERPCPLLTLDEVAAAFGATEAVQLGMREGTVAGASGLPGYGLACWWQADPVLWELGDLNANALQMDSAAAAREEYDQTRAGLATQRFTGCEPAGPADGALREVRPVPGVGDEAVAAPGQLLAVEDNLVVNVTLCVAGPRAAGEPLPPAVPGDIDTLASLGAAIVGD
ncbi:MAG: hypothetical protein IRZ08_01110 [Frankia sp.]|nr:hypothetical protein [Frankia sp.]